MAVLAVLFVLGVVFRILGAWCFSYSASSDHGLVCLMAKHIAEGRELPVFYYGQPYMGSLEPIISSLLCRWLGFSGFAVNLGTALAGVLLLPFVYRWGRDAGGKVAGAAALAFCLVGSLVFFQYQCWSYGGYAMLVLISTALLWGTACVIEKEQSGQAKIWYYLIIGILAGLGWWTSQLITQTFMAAGLLYLLVLRRRAFNPRLLAAVPAFVVGSLPFWIWNAGNDWKTFRFFAGSTGQIDFGEGLQQFITDRIFGLIGIGDTPTPFRGVANVLYVVVPVMMVIALALLISDIRRKGLQGSSIHLLASFLFLVSTAVMFAGSTSRFAAVPAGRYMLPLFPALAVIIGRATAGLCARLPFKLGWLPLLFMIGLHATVLPVYLAWGTSGVHSMKTVNQFGGLLKELKIDAAYAHHTSRGPNHSLNYLLNEAVVFSDPIIERYPPYAEQVELSGSPAVLCNYDHVDAFLDSTMGTGTVSGIEAYYVHHDFTPPAGGLEEIPPDMWEAVTDSESQHVLGTVSDGNAATFWHSLPPDKDSDWLEIQFAREMTVVAVRILSRPARYPQTWRIQSMNATGNWVDATAEMSVRDYFWSGPRLYQRGRGYRLEARFPPTRTKAIRVAVAPGHTEVAELQLFAPAPQPADWQASFGALSALLTERGLTDIYSDRWVANRLYRTDNPIIRVSGEPSFLKRSAALLPTRVDVSPLTALVVGQESAPLTRRVLEAAGVRSRETAVGPWFLFDQLWRHGDGRTALFWCGFTCVTRGKTNDNTEPDIPTEMAFPKGIEFVGLSVLPSVAAPGSAVDLLYFWRCPEDVATDELITFVHFKRPAGTVFQDDHVFLEHADTAYQRDGEILVERRSMRIPEDAPAGAYDVSLGLYNHLPPHARLKVKTTQDVHKRAAILYDVLTVSSNEVE
jgi:4-amino-4-deoxy-L-arabinose transferase-like glycosyltransferase